MEAWKNHLLVDMPYEIWKDIPGYEGIFQASSMGRVKSLERLVVHGRSGAYNRKSRILKSVNKSIYGTGIKREQTHLRPLSIIRANVFMLGAIKLLKKLKNP